jgi:hypothetical protein
MLGDTLRAPTKNAILEVIEDCSCKLLVALSVRRVRLTQQEKQTFALRLKARFWAGNVHTQSQLLKCSAECHLLVGWQEVTIWKTVWGVGKHIGDVFPQVVNTFHHEHTKTPWRLTLELSGRINREAIDWSA